MKPLLLGLLTLLASHFASAQTLYTFNGGGTSGNWTDTNTWTTDPTGSTSVGARLPQPNDALVVTNSYVLNLTAHVPTTGLSVTVQRGGVLNLNTFAFQTAATTPVAVPLAQLAGQGLLRIGRAYFPGVTTNNFDDAGTGTVEFYNWSTTPGTLPVPGSGQYNNLRLLNTTATAFVAQLNGNLTLTGALALTRSSSAAVALNLGQTASTNRSLTVQGDVTVGTGTSLGVTAVAGEHTLNVGGSLTNNGIVTLHNGTDAQRCLLRFTGTTDATLACNGPTDLSRLQVDKGAGSTAVLNVTSAATLPEGGNLRLNFIANAALLLLNNGTVKLGPNIVLPRLRSDSGNYDIGSPSTSPTLWIAGATVLNNNANALVAYGTFRISGGRFECLGQEGVVTREDGQYIIEGGTTVVEKFRPSNTATTHRGAFTITGGVFECSGTGSDGNHARFSHPYPTQSFRMTGGIIRVRNPQNSSGLFHIGVNADNATVTGGTIELQLPATGTTATTCKVASTAPLWNLSISRPAAGSLNAILDGIGSVSGATITAQPLTVLNNFTIGGSNPAALNANSQDVNIEGTFTIDANCAYLPTTNTTRFSGGQNQLLTNNGSIGSTLNTFFNLTVDKSAGTLTLDGTAAIFTVSNTLSLLNGVLNDGSKQVNVVGNIVNSASHTSGGGTGAIVLTGTGTHTIGGNGEGVFGNLTINSTATTGTAPVALTASQTVASVLTLQSLHVLDIGANRLSLTSISPNAVQAGPGGTGVFSSQRLIRTAGNQSDMGLRKTYGGADAFTFPMGTGTGTSFKYTPATIALTQTLPLYGKVSVSPANARNPFVTSTSSLAYYWKVRAVDFGPIPAGKITASFTMLNTDATGTLTSYVPGRYLPVAWTSSGNVAEVAEGTSSSVISFPGLSQFEGEYTAGLPAAFGAITAYYSLGNGNWEAPGTWSTVSHTGTPATVGPGAGNPVFIGRAASNLFHTVTVTAAAARSGSLVIDRGSVLDVATLIGHNFGALPDATAGGAGRLRISVTGTGNANTPAVAQFPGGDFGSFLQPGGGTVEYYTSGKNLTLPTTSLTGLSLSSYKSLWLNAATEREINLPNLDLRVYANLRAGTSAAFSGMVLLSPGTNGNLTVDSLLAVQNGVLRYSNAIARSVTATTNVAVSAGATFDVSPAGTAVANALTVGGTLTNDGILDLNAGSSRRASLTFTGSANTSLTSTAAATAATLTDLSTLLISKGTTQTPVLTLDVAGTLTTPTNSWLTINSGTLRYAKAGTSTLTIHDAASVYTINDAAALTVDAPGATVTLATAADAAADLQLAGQLQVLQGRLSVGLPANAVGNDLEYASAGGPAVKVSGTGVLYVNGQIRRSTANTSGSLRYEQTGGAVEIGGFGASAASNRERGLLEVQGPGSSFAMSGGTLTLRRSNTNPAVIGDLYLRPETTSVTAGTVVLGNAAAGAGNVAVSVDSTVPLYDLLVQAGADATSQNTGLLTGSALTLKGSLTIGNDNSFFQAAGLGLNIARGLTNNNASASTSISGGGFQPGTTAQATTFTGGIAGQQLSGAAGNLTVFGSLVLNNAQPNGGLTLNREARVAGSLTLTRGILADNAQTITVLGDVFNSAIHTSGSPANPGGGSLTLAGAASQSVGGNGMGQFGNVTLSNAAGATTAAAQQITGVLTFGSGALTIGSNLLWLSSTSAGAVSGVDGPAGRYIRTNGIVADLGVRKSYPATASDFTFPVGVSGKYTPVRLNVTANTAAGTVTVRPINTAHPSTTNAQPRELNYYWKISKTDFSPTPTLTQTFSYVAADVSGTESSYKLGRFLDGAWTPTGGISGSTVSTTARTLANANVSYFEGDYTGGEPSEFGAVHTFYSRNATAGQPAGASWNDASAWTFNSDGTDSATLPATFPTAANPVVIRSAHLINANGSGRGAANLTLLGTGTLDLAANGANNFNTVTGTGTLRIGSALFPAGNYDAFMTGATGGTVDYTGAVQLPARDRYNNLVFSGANAKELSNLDLTINGALTTSAGTTLTNPTSQNITLTSATQGAQLAGAFNLNDGSLTILAFLTNSAPGALTLGAGTLSVGTALTNTGTISSGSGGVSVGTAFSNSGTYNAAAGTGALTVGSTFSNSGSYAAGTGDLTVASSFTNAAGGAFTAASGKVTVGSGFTNAGTYTAASGNTLAVAGDFSNAATGGFGAGSSDLELQGNFSNASPAGFNAGTGLVKFLANVGRTLTGTTTFYNVQKTGSGTLSLGPGTDATVSNLLTLQNGLLSTGTSNTLRLTNTSVQPIVSTGISAYVSGRLAMSLPNTAAASREFPVGLGGRYRPVIIQQGASVSPVVLIEIFNGSPGGSVSTTDNPNLSNLSANRYYRIQLLSGTLNSPTVQLSFNTDVVDEEVNVPGNLRVARSTGNAGPWSNAGGAGVYSPAAPRGYTISAPVVVDGTSFFALASTNAVDNPLTGLAPLPVELTRFGATPQGPAVRVTWATATEQNSDYFLVQRAGADRRFVNVGQVQAQGSSARPHDYTLLDAAPLRGLSYYRLRQVDLDGTAAYSPVVAVRFDGTAAGAAPALLAYPNPASGQGFRLLTTNLGAQGGIVRMVDAQGRLVLTQTVSAGAAETAVQPARPLAAGLYFVTWQAAGGVKLTTKVVVE